MCFLPSLVGTCAVKNHALVLRSLIFGCLSYFFSTSGSLNWYSGVSWTSKFCYYFFHQWLFKLIFRLITNNSTALVFITNTHELTKIVVLGNRLSWITGVHSNDLPQKNSLLSLGDCSLTELVGYISFECCLSLPIWLLGICFSCLSCAIERVCGRA
jgi:hypothetical protein